MPLYYISIEGGLCGLTAAKTLGAAKAEAKREHGRYRQVRETRLATQEDIAWVKIMGGQVPAGATKRNLS